MQDILKYASILSLLRYHLVLQKYWKYYDGMIPMMSGRERRHPGIFEHVLAS